MDAQKKFEYAISLLRHPEDPFKAALSVWPNDTATALSASKDLPNDPDVKTMCDELVMENGQAAFLPTKEDLARAVWQRANKTLDPEVAFKGYKLYADIRGFIDKAGTTINNNTLVDNRSVMVYKDHGTDEEWAAKALAQQSKLIEDGAKPRQLN